MPFRRYLGTAIALFGWDEEQFWTATPQAFAAALREYEAIFAPGSARHKRRTFAAFRSRVEAADARRRATQAPEAR